MKTKEDLTVRISKKNNNSNIQDLLKEASDFVFSILEDDNIPIEIKSVAFNLVKKSKERAVDNEKD